MQASIVFVASAILVSCVHAGPYPGPSPNALPQPGPVAAPQPLPYPAPLPYALPGPQPYGVAFADVPSCGGPGSQCGAGGFGPECCGGYGCENGACYPITNYAGPFYGPPRVKGGYGLTFSYGS